MARYKPDDSGQEALVPAYFEKQTLTGTFRIVARFWHLGPKIKSQSFKSRFLYVDTYIWIPCTYI